jgi:hypothetical protein
MVLLGHNSVTPVDLMPLGWVHRCSAGDWAYAFGRCSKYRYAWVVEVKGGSRVLCQEKLYWEVVAPSGT